MSVVNEGRADVSKSERIARYELEWRHTYRSPRRFRRNVHRYFEPAPANPRMPRWYKLLLARRPRG